MADAADVADAATARGSDPRTVAYLGLGANLGDRAASLRAAAERLRATAGIEALRLASIRETAPVGGPAGQPPFLNTVAEVVTSLGPRPLWERCREIETALGRRREAEVRWGPRVIDIDLLLHGETILRTAALTVPHPRWRERLFVLEPLAELAPTLRDPETGRTARRLLDEARGR